MSATFTDDWTSIHHGDCLEVMRGMEACSIDAIVTDPPYGLSFMGREWDHGVPGEAFWAEALRVAKPGAHLVAFGGTRTYHRLAVAIEDAGWEIRDCLGWLYGSGFPKSLDVSKAISAQETHGSCRPSDIRKVAMGDKYEPVGGTHRQTHHPGSRDRIDDSAFIPTLAAQRWQGWGTALKPAWESIILASKPFPECEERATIVANLSTIEEQLWWLLSVSDAASDSRSSQAEQPGATSASAPPNAAELLATRDALCARTDTSRFVSAISSCLSTVTSWKNTLADGSTDTSTFITSTGTSQTIAWRTLRSSVSALTPHTMLQAAIAQPGSWWNALPAALTLSVVCESINATRAHSALVSAIDAGLICSPDGDALSSLSPAWEPIILARKPLTGTVAANVQRYGTGAINVDGCRVDAGGGRPLREVAPLREEVSYAPTSLAGRVDGSLQSSKAVGETTLGRWPANIVHDGSDEVLAVFPQTSSDSGSAARFFYTAKASKSERDDGLRFDRNTHPTVKPLDLMRWLVRLVTPPDGIVLDPFMGSGTTLKAARAEGHRSIGIDLEREHCEIAWGRLSQGVLL